MITEALDDLATLILGRLEVPPRTLGYVQTDQPIWKPGPARGVRFATPRGLVEYELTDRVYLVGVKTAPPPVRAASVQVGDIIQGYGKVLAKKTFGEDVIDFKIIVDADDSIERVQAMIEDLHGV